MCRFIKDADVFVSNYRPKAIKRLGFDYETLHELNPRLIYATISGFGEEGPAADNPGYDPVAFWARGGLLHDFAEKGSLLVPPIAVGDIASGQALAGGRARCVDSEAKDGRRHAALHLASCASGLSQSRRTRRDSVRRGISQVSVGPAPCTAEYLQVCGWQVDRYHHHSRLQSVLRAPYGSHWP